MRVTPNERYAEYLKYICDSTAQKLSVNEAREGYETIAATNKIILLPTDKNFIVSHDNTERYIVTTDNQIELFGKPYRALMMLANNTLSTVMYSGSTIAVSTENDLETEGMYAVGEKASIITNLHRHPIYTQVFDPNTNQNVITVKYYDLGRLKFSTDDTRITISFPQTSS